MISSPSAKPSNSAPFCALGIDVGGTKIAAGVVSFPEGKVHARRTIPTLPTRGGEAVLADVERLAGELTDEARADRLAAQAIGLGVCELVDRAGNLASANCLDWRGLPVRERLSQIAPAVLEADVRAAALGEACFGAGKSFRLFLYLTVGTGISSCLVLDAKPFTGARGATGTVGSSPLPSASGSVDAPMPTLEQLASGPGLVARFNQSGGKAKCGEEVLTAAKAGDTRAVTIVRSAGEALGAVVGWLVNVLDPEAVVIGGGLGLSEGLFRETLLASARRHIWSELHRDLPILPAALGSDAGVIGAATSARNYFDQADRRNSPG